MFSKYIDNNDFEIAVLENNKLKVEINLSRGLIFKSLTLNDCEAIYIDTDNYLSNERPRCGCPVLFPFSGNNADNKLYIHNQVFETSIHGLAHSNKWTLIHHEENMARFKTTQSDFSKASYPFDFDLIATVTLDENSLNYSLDIKNNSQAIMPADCGFHPFFKISNLDNLMIEVDGSNNISLEQVKTTGQMFKNVHKVSYKDDQIALTMELTNGLKNLIVWSGKPDKFIVLEPLSGYPNAINELNNAFNLNFNETANVSFKLTIE